jgi:hypothetical protein
MNKELEQKLEKILQVCAGIKPGDIVHVSIEHDDRCPALLTHNLADCTCKPNIRKVRMS